MTAAYMKFEAFRKIVDAVGRFLRDKFLPIVTDLPGTFMTGFKHILDGVSWLANGIKNGFQGAFNFVLEQAHSLIDTLLSIFQKFAEGMSNIPIIGGQFAGVATNIQTVRTGLEGLVDDLKLDIADIDLAEEWGLNG